MGRKKHKPQRSIGVPQNIATSGNSCPNNSENIQIIKDIPYYVNVDKSTWYSSHHKDISEIVLVNLNVSHNFVGFDFSDDFDLRFRLCNVIDQVGRIKLGHWPVISSENVFLEACKKRVVGNNGDDDDDDGEVFDVIVSGQFDGSDEGVSGLIHLVSLKFLSLRVVLGSSVGGSVRLRVEVLDNVFDVCESVLENTRQSWKKSMVSVMGWLRPEVTTSEARYGVCGYEDVGVGFDQNGGANSMFDVGRFYEALRRSKDLPVLDVELPDLIPELRPYQRRAAYWMVQREKGNMQHEQTIPFTPLCLPVSFLDSSSKMFYNPFRAEQLQSLRRYSELIVVRALGSYSFAGWEQVQRMPFGLLVILSLLISRNSSLRTSSFSRGV